MFRRSKRAPSLLDQIEADVLAERPLKTVLRKCLFLGSEAGSTELREWASHELNGYYEVEPDEVPEYRHLTAPLLIDGMTPSHHITGQPVAPMVLARYNSGLFNENYVVRDSVARIEDMASGAEATRIAPPGAADLVSIMNMDNPGQQIERLYWSVAPIASRGVAEGIRTALAELVAETRAGLSGPSERPGSELLDQAYRIAVWGVGNRVTITHAELVDGDVEVTIGTDTQTGFWTPVRKLWGFLGSAASIIALGAVFAEWQGWLQLAP